MAKTRRNVWSAMVHDEKGDPSRLGKEPVEDNPFAEDLPKQNDMRTRGSIDNASQLNRSSMDDILYIHPNDHANLQLVAVLLTGNNFYTWNRSVKRALGARNKLDFINGNLLEPPSDSYYHKGWMKADYMVSTWLMNSMSKEIATAFQYIDNSRTLWEEISNRFDRSSGPKLYQLDRDLSQCVQNNQTVMEYFNNMNAIWDEINVLNPVPVCGCVICECGADRAMRQMIEKRKLNQFLLGLNDSFETVRSQILMTEPLPSVSKAYSLILQDEDQRKATSKISHISESAMLAKSPQFTANPRFHRSGFSSGFGSGRPRLSKEERKKLVCKNCGYNGHEVSECFKLHGVPEWYKLLKEERGRLQAHCVTKFGNPEYKVEQLVKSEVQKCMSQIHQGGRPVEQKEHVNLVDSNPLVSFDRHFAFGITDGDSTSQWILDSGASTHICCNQNLMKSVYRLDTEQRVFLPDGSAQFIHFAGKVQLTAEIELDNVLLAPSFTHNLVSVAALAKQLGAKCTFLDTHCLIQKKNADKVLGIARADGKLYIINTGNIDYACNVVKIDGLSALDWHIKLGHVSITTMQHIDMLKSLCNTEGSSLIEACDICHRARQCRNPFPLSQSRSTSLFELIHIDVWGPYHGESVTNTPYILTIVEDFSRATWTFLMSSKLQVFGILSDYIHMVHTQFGVSVKRVRSDNGSEFLNNKVHDLFAEKGILHQTSCFYTPQQNGVVERKNRTLLQMARAVMYQGKMPSKFWSYSILFATWMINRLPSVVLGWKTPYELLFNERVNLSLVQPFGSLVYAATVTPHRSEFDVRSNKCVFLGFAANSKAHILFNMDTEEIFHSRDVHCFGNIFPYDDIDSPSTCLSNSGSADYSRADVDPLQFVPAESSLPVHDSNTDASFQPLNSTDLSSDVVDSNRNDTVPVQRPRRVIKPPSWTKDFVACVSSFSTTLLSMGEILTPYTFPYIISPIFLPHYVNSLVHITDFKEPVSYKEACTKVEWVEAMQVELDALEKNGTWILTDLPGEKHVIGSKWVYKTKLKADGTVERFKARLVAKGYNQEYGIDYEEVFSPVAKLVTVRLILALAAYNGWLVHQIDINNAFLHGHLQEDIFMSRPQGYTKGEPGQVCKLVKSLYGLKQASREWNTEFCKALFHFGFQQSVHDHCLFTMGSGDTFLGLLVYVDDVLIVSPTLNLITQIKDFLNHAFTIKDLGLAKFFLGMEIAFGDSGVYVCQRKYILEILDRLGMLACKPSATPFPPGLKLSAHDLPLFDKPDQYRTLIGQLLYLNFTRPDIAFSIQQLSQFLNSPSQKHWDAALNVLRYLKGSPSLGLFYAIDIMPTFTAYSDSDWGTCPDSRRSLTGFCVFVGSSLISWRCKKQSTVSLSTAEAEYRALSHCARELQWLHSLFTEVCGDLQLPILVYCDNSAAIQITKNQVFHERTKHIELACHHVRDLFRSGFLTPTHVSTRLQLADAFTKNLLGPRLVLLLSKMGLVDLHRVHLEGGCYDYELKKNADR